MKKKAPIVFIIVSVFAVAAIIIISAYAANVLLIMFHQRKIVGTFAQFAFGRMTRLLLLIATPVT